MRFLCRSGGDCGGDCVLLTSVVILAELAGASLLGRAAAPDAIFGGASPPSEVTHTVGERIAFDSKRIGLVAQRLLEVQNSIDSVEKEVVGKVFDVDSLRNFLGAHRAAADDSDQLRASMVSTSATVDSLTKQLEESRKSLAKREVEHQRLMAEMEAELAGADAEIKTLKRVVVEEVEYEKQNQTLTTETHVLLNHRQVEVAEVNAATGELAAVNAELARRKQSTLELEAMTRRQHIFSANCHLKAERLRLRLVNEERRIAAAVNQDSSREAEATQVEHGLMSENHGFKTRLAKAKHNAATFQAQLVTTKGRRAALQQQGQEDLWKLRKSLGMARQKADAKEGELNAHMHARASVEKSVLQAQASVDKLQGDILSGLFAELRANITQIKTDLNRTLNAHEQSKAQVSASWGTIAQTKATITVLRRSAEENAEQAREIAQMSMSQVAKAKQYDDGLAKEAEAATLEAEASVLTDCGHNWRKTNQGITQELESCQQAKEDLQKATAEVDFLMNSMSGVLKKSATVQEPRAKVADVAHEDDYDPD